LAVIERGRIEERDRAEKLKSMDKWNDFRRRRDLAIGRFFKARGTQIRATKMLKLALLQKTLRV